MSGYFACCFRIQHVFDLQQLFVKMINDGLIAFRTVFFTIHVLTRLDQRVIDALAVAATVIDGPSDADAAQTVQPVSILDDLALARQGWSCIAQRIGKRHVGNDIHDCLDLLIGQVNAPQEIFQFFLGFFYADYQLLVNRIVQIGRGNGNKLIGSFGFNQFFGHPYDAHDVVETVSSTVTAQFLDGVAFDGLQLCCLFHKSFPLNNCSRKCHHSIVSQFKRFGK